ncbi:MAG TPA: 3-oxoacyl-[acyl-carrier-protein] reductase [Gemmatimonadales bacterium]|jgi:3-oxoacyl-[acyl-carrier protein] reductase|nr:3-oxoacyl-[acyl-carrier-protein] reductase [Gemmatimonadales bacterium]
MTINLSGKVALVTGGTRGIGQAIAERLYGAGAHVAILGRDPARAQEALAALAGKGRALAVQADVSLTADVEAAVAQVEKDLGPVDILVNNAGFTKDGLLVRMGEADWDSVLDTNLKGAFNTMRLVGRTMIKRRWGRIINITSVIGLTGNRGQANYAASKAGLIGLTKAVARELASRNVLVNAVAPGFIDTDLTRGLPDPARKVLTDQIAVGRLGTPGDVAGVVLFLASDLADYITGQVLVVDGGLVM